MESWFVLVFSISLCLLMRAFFNLLFPSRSPPLPPGPPHIPIISSLSFLRKPFSELEPILRNLHAKYGPIVTHASGSRPAIFIIDRSLAYQALVQNGTVFSSRPKALATGKIITSNQHSINSAFYGPTWRVLRRNLTYEMLHPNRVKSFSGIRKRVLEDLLNRLKSASESGNSIRVIDHLQYAMFSLLVSMCFGEGLDENQIKDIEYVLRRQLVNSSRFNILNFWPSVTRIFFRKRWEEFLKFRKEKVDVLMRAIKGRQQDEALVPYLDTLLNLELPEEKRKLDESEVVTLCSEFLIAGTDTTATALQWILANLVKHSNIQQRLAEEIREVRGEREGDKDVKEEDLQRLSYLKAVILEGLRRHPPLHFLLPHAVSEDVVFNDYLIPKDGIVNFIVAEIGWDPKVWEDPMEFKPERFLNCEEAFDITGSKEIKMLPFGAGRRICPGYNLAILHLEYFVANLIWKLEWKASSSNGDIDLSEKEEFTTVMKYPLQVYLSPRL